MSDQTIPEDLVVLGTDYVSAALTSLPATISIDVLPVNDAPTLASVDDLTLLAGEPLALGVVATDVDGGDTLTYNLVDAPAGMGVNSASGAPLVKARNLPKAFDGLRIVQISDLHLGSFSKKTEVVQHGIDLINAQQPDLILFTGDLVNNFAEEVEPWLEQFSGLKATMGMYSILGNHDYGEYSTWPSAAAKAGNLERLKAHHRTMGFRLLMDEHVPIEKDGEQFSLIGVQNWGTRFQQYGDLAKASAGTDPGKFRLLLSHDPTHWDAQVRDTGIDLMLAGHTHGAQFGINIAGHTYSPAQWIYEEWAGLYEKKGLQLYVNRGFGFIGFPGRIGMPPEITVLELECA